MAHLEPHAIETSLYSSSPCPRPILALHLLPQADLPVCTEEWAPPPCFSRQLPCDNCSCLARAWQPYLIRGQSFFSVFSAAGRWLPYCKITSESCSIISMGFRAFASFLSVITSLGDVTFPGGAFGGGFSPALWALLYLHRFLHLAVLSQPCWGACLPIRCWPGVDLLVRRNVPKKIVGGALLLCP